MPDGTDTNPQTRAAEAGAEQQPSSAESPAASSAPEATPPIADAEREAQFFIVGIGASAGGLEALGALLKRVTLESMALVVVQHLAPKLESALPALLSRASHTNVAAAVDGMRVQPNHIYVIPPNTDLAILHGVLHLMRPPAGPGVRLPIDYFFRSLAKDQGSRSIGIVLSGTGTDGTFGLKAIKEAGGITFAQDPSSAKYDGMPRSALESGWADFCLNPEAMADALLQVGRHPYLSKVQRVSPQTIETVGKLLVMLRAAYGTDFTYYKPSMIDRRVERRMALHKIEKLDDYIKFTQGNAGELDLLYRDMLIGVTSFFRDHAAFDAVKAKVFPRIMQGKEAGSPIRIWVPACSTGEEAYSLAMCFLEYLDDKASDFRIQVFGTDIDTTAIQHARRGIYPQNIALDVSEERLHRFFVKRESDYQISRRIRDMVVFSVQNVTRDPPFSRLDMASCRNLLIYLIPAMQKKVLRIMHYSLQPEGFLLLGTSETVGESADLFNLVDRDNKVYVRKQTPVVAGLDIGFGMHPQVTAQAGQTGTAAKTGTNIAALADRKVLEMYGPPGVVITDEMEVVYIRGHTGGYLEPMPGAPSFNLLRLARPELQYELRRAVHEAQTRSQRVAIETRFNDQGTPREVGLEVIPMADSGANSRLMLVLFHEPKAAGEQPAPEQPARPKSSTPAEDRIQELERDLMMTKEYLQTTIEELESTNEELKSSNEEMQSSNEELQSTNEELETSKEELQSANEELTTVNDELQDRMAELQQSNDDLHNVLAGLGTAVVIVGMDLRIRRYTHAAARILNLIAGDVGRSVSQLNGFVVGQRLEELAANVIATLMPIEREVICSDQRWYLLHITPYRTLDHSIKGAVISLLDIESRKRSPGTLAEVVQVADGYLGIIDHPLLIADPGLHVLWTNPAFQTFFEVSPEQVVGKILGEPGPAPLAIPELVARVERLGSTKAPFKDSLVRFSLPGGVQRNVKVSGNRVPGIGTDSFLLLLSFAREEPAGR